MEKKNEPRVLTAIALASMCGVRSLLPLALLSARRAHRGAHASEGSVVGDARGWLSQRTTARGLVALALAELAADKSPRIPSRTAPVGLLGRALTGGTIATTLLRGRARAPIVFVAGACAAVAAAFATSYARKKARESGIDNVAAGLLEDSAALAATRRLLGTRRPAPVGTPTDATAASN